MSKPRIAICGIHIESSTFTPYISTEADFQVTRRKNLPARYAWMDQSWARQVEWLPVLHARALPGGVVERTAYESWKAEIMLGLGALAPLDGIFFDIHGAMSVEGMDDAEGDLIKAIRDAVGEEPIVSASMDLHGNVSMDLFEGCDLLTCYRMAPHEDALESRERAARNLVERIVSGAGKPAKALADQPRCKAAVVVTGDDAEDVAAQASVLALGLDPRDADVVVVKIGYLEPDLRPLLTLTRSTAAPQE